MKMDVGATMECPVCEVERGVLYLGTAFVDGADMTGWECTICGCHIHEHPQHEDTVHRSINCPYQDSEAEEERCP